MLHNITFVLYTRVISKKVKTNTLRSMVDMAVMGYTTRELVQLPDQEGMLENNWISERSVSNFEQIYKQF